MILNILCVQKLGWNIVLNLLITKGGGRAYRMLCKVISRNAWPVPSHFWLDWCRLDQIKLLVLRLQDAAILGRSHHFQGWKTRVFFNESSLAPPMQLGFFFSSFTSNSGLLFQLLCWKSVVTYFRNIVRLKEQCWVNITILSPKHIFALDILLQGVMYRSVWPFSVL